MSAPARTSVVHLVLTLHIGGLEKVVYDLIRSADRDRFSFRVLCLGEVGDLGPAFAEIGVPVESLDVHRRGPLRSMRAVAGRLRELRPDVLHAHNEAPYLTGAAAARMAGVPTVIQTRHGRHVITGWKSFFAARLAAWCTDRVVAVSTDAVDFARRFDHVPDSRIAVIRNGIDLDRFPRCERGRDAPLRRAIHVARLEESVKDQSTLLRAMRLIADAHPDFVLDIVGDGPSRHTLEALCDELRLRPNVNFLGFRHDVHDLLRQADLFLLSSVSEGLSISLLEAMAAGLPVVATNVGGNPEIVIDGETGLLVPPRLPEALAKAALELVRQPERASRMGLAGRQRVEDHFELRHTAAAYEALYCRLLERRGGAGRGVRRQAADGAAMTADRPAS